MKLTFSILLTGFILFSWSDSSNAQGEKYSVYWQRRADLFEKLPTSSEDIIFLGNSITDGAEWSELYGNPDIKNRGISGDITTGVYDRLGTIINGKPAKVFLLIGINDVSRGISADSIVKNIGMLIDEMQKGTPDTKIYLQSILPVNDHFKKYLKHSTHWALVPEINKNLEKLAEEKQVTYIEVFSHLTDESGLKLNPKFTNDGLHLMGDGYLVWRDILEPYIKE